MIQVYDPVKRPAAPNGEAVTKNPGGTEGKAVVLLSPILLGRQAAARVLDVSLSTLDHLVGDGSLPSVLIGNRRMFRPAALERWAAGLPLAAAREPQEKLDLGS